MMLRAIRWALAAALAAGVAPAFSTAAQEAGAEAEDANAITIGCMFPMSGRAGLYGKDSVAAIEMAVDEVNRRGGAAGRTLRVLFADSQSKPAFAVHIARRYILDDKVDFLCGVISSSVGLAVSEVARTHKKLFIGTDHASSRLTIENLHPYYFRVSNSAYQSMAAGALYLAELQKQQGWRTIAFIGPDYEYGHGMWDDLRSALDELGVRYTVAAELWPKLYEPDYTAYIAAILRANPDITVNGHWGGDFVAFLRQAKAYDLFAQTKLVNFDAGGNYEVMAALREDMPLGLVLSARHHNNWPDTELNRQFVTRFHGHAGRYPSYAAEGAYASILAIATAVDQIGDPSDTDALIRALERLRIKLPEDPDGFTSYMDADTHQMVQVQAIGTVVPDERYPPAKTMLGDWKIYPAEMLMPKPDVIERRRALWQRGSVAADVPGK